MVSAIERDDKSHCHLDDPDAALDEILRVTKSGGRLAFGEGGFGLLLYPAPDLEVFWKFHSYWVDQFVTNPNAGLHLYGVFTQRGLVDISIMTVSVSFTDFAVMNGIYQIEKYVEQACRDGVLSEVERDRLLAHLHATDEAGTCLAIQTGIGVAGTKP